MTILRKKKWGLEKNRPEEKMRSKGKNVSLRMYNAHEKNITLNEDRHMVIEERMGSGKYVCIEKIGPRKG